MSKKMEREARIDNLIEEIGKLRYKVNQCKQDLEEEEDTDEIIKIKDELADYEKDMACLTEELHKLYLEIRMELGDEEEESYDGLYEVLTPGDY